MPRSKIERDSVRRSGSAGGGGAVPAFAVPAADVDVGDAAAEGVAATIVRSDHQHAVPAPGVAPPNVAAVSAIGVATTPARSDHTHGQQAGLVLDRAEFHGDELMIINNADWPINANAPTESDSNNAAWKVSRFDDPSGGSTGRGFRRKVQSTATIFTIHFILRGDGVAISADAEFDLWWREMNLTPAAAVPAWSFFNLSAMTVRADAFQVEYSQAITIGAGGGEIDLNLGKWHEFEINRNGEGDLYAASVDVGGIIIEQT